jgi:hypothetical protein
VDVCNFHIRQSGNENTFGGNKNLLPKGWVVRGGFFVFPTLGMGSPARGSLFIKQPTHTQHTHTIFSPSEDMKSTKRPSGNWGPIQDKLVGDLLRSNTIDYRNRTGEYLFAVSEEHFPNFITPGTTGRNSAIQRMRNKFTRYEQDLLVRGARGKKKSCGVH